MPRYITCTLLAGLWGLLLVRPPVTPAQEPPPPPTRLTEPPVPEGTEVQARGQVHEAYGEPSRAQAVEGILVDRTPPAPIEEAPPEDKGAAALPPVHQMHMERVKPATTGAGETGRHALPGHQQGARRDGNSAYQPGSHSRGRRPLKVKMELPKNTPPARIIFPLTAVHKAPAADTHHSTITPKPVNPGPVNPKPKSLVDPKPRTAPQAYVAPTPKPHPT